MAKIKVSEGDNTIEIETDSDAQFYAVFQLIYQGLYGEREEKGQALTLEEKQREYLRKVEPTEEHREEARRVLAVYIEEKAKGENAYSAWIKNIEEGVAASIARQEHGKKYQVPGTAEDAETIES